MSNDSYRYLNPTTDHAHTSTCWWNHEQARWVCPSNASQISTQPVTVAPGVEEVATAKVDVRDMLVVHTALLREFRLVPQAVGGVPVGARKRARTVDRHLGLLCELLHHHHEGEDELLWPVLRDRLAIEDTAMLDVAEAQHAGLAQALTRVATARPIWVEHIDPKSRSVLVEALESLCRLLTEHLEAEERHLLPLAAAHLTGAEWHAVGEAGAASIPKSAMPLVFGMFAYEGDPEVLAGMLKAAPAVPRLIVPRIATRLYARRATQIYGTPRP